jgi:predicted ABC-type transport system involved in lysophospholipase L1 biosynthesis ATPase subunit
MSTLLLAPAPASALATRAPALPPSLHRFAPTAPILLLHDVGVGHSCLSLQAHAGEILHLGGGTAMARLRLLTRAAGFEIGSSGRCAMGGVALHELDDAQRHTLRQHHVTHVLLGDTLPAAASVQASVALPLVQQGLQIHDALTRAALSLDELGAGHLAHLSPSDLSASEARMALLARALAQRPQLLVLEHPEAGLSASAVSALRLALWALCSSSDTSVVMSSDHPRLVASADRYIDLDAGWR